MVSTCPNIMVALVVIFNWCAAAITSNHSSAPHFPLDTNLLTRSTKISAPAPGKESMPASCNVFNTWVCVCPPNLAICAISGGPNVCNLIVGNSDLICLNKLA